MNNLSLWQQLTGFPYLELYVKLLSGAMQLDVFSDLTEKTTVATLAKSAAGTPPIQSISSPH